MPKTKTNTTPQETADLFGPEAGTDSPMIKTSRRIINRITGQICQLRPTPEELDMAAGPQQIDVFVAHLLDAGVKDDRASMGAPIFSLATKPDLSIWSWTSADKKRSVRVIPSVLGRATMHDKDVLIYVTSVLVAAMDQALKAEGPMPGRRVEFTMADYLKATGKARAGYTYGAFEDALARLKGTFLITNIARNPRSNSKKAFGLIETYDYDTLKQADGTRVINQARPVQVVVSEWLYDMLLEREVLTLSRDYWALRKPLEKRLYELARMHCGQQPQWLVSATVLHKASGSRASLRRFRQMMVDIMGGPTLPEYDVMPATTADGEKGYKFALVPTITRHKMVRRVPQK